MEITPDKLIEMRTNKGFSQEEVAKLVGVSQRAYSMWERGQTKPKHGSMMKLLEVLEVSTTPLSGIPLIPAEAIAGKKPGELVIRDADIEERYVVPDFAKADFLIRVKGDSMEPHYHSGDLLACKHLNHHADFVQWNRAYVIDTTQGILVKRILKSENGRWLLRSDNKDYQDIEVNPAKDIHHINLVLGVIRLE